MTELKPCPWCGSAPFFHPELSDGSTRLECGGDCCPMEETYTPRGSREFVVTVWNRRPAAGAEPEVVAKALDWALAEIDVLSNRLVSFAYPQGMPMIGREDQFEHYKSARALLSVPRSVKDPGAPE